MEYLDDLSDEFFNPKQLKTLAFNVEKSEGNNLLHQFVLEISDPNNSVSGNYVNAVLLSISDISDISVDALNHEGYSALHLAVLNNNLFMVKKLLSCLRKININIKSGGYTEKNTPLHLAAMLCQVSIIQELLNKGANVNRRNKNGFSALCFAAKSGDLDTVQLLRKGENVNLLNSRWCLPHYAPESGNLEAVKVLVSNGADVNAKNKYSKTPLCYAIESGNLVTAEFLVNNGAYLNADHGWNSLFRSAKKGNLSMIKFVLDIGVIVNIKNVDYCKLLHWAARSGDLETIKFFVDKGADVNTKDHDYSTPLHWVVRSCNLDSVKFIVGKGADINAKDKYSNNPLYYALYKENSECAAFLIDHGADLHAIDTGGKTPLYRAVYTNSLECAKLLIENGADLHVIDREGKTLLHHAVYKGNLECVTLLVDQGTDMHAADKDGKTPLHYAVYRNNLECAELLIDRGADLHAIDKNGRAPLHEAVEKDYLECAELLISKIADLNTIYKNGRTLLHEAVIGESISFVKILIERGADVNVRDASHGYTPLHHLISCLNSVKKVCHSGYTNDAGSLCDCGRNEINMYVRKIKLLLDGNADVNIKDEAGETPLCWAMRYAARTGLYDIVKLFSEVKLI